MSKIVKEIIKCLVIFSMAVGISGCGKKSSEDKNVITNSGSDTMVNLAQMWAEEYQKIKPGVSVEVGGGGSGVGIRDLMQGIVQVANASRDMKDSEKAQAKQNTGKEPLEWIVGYDAVAVYVNKNNPVESLTLAQLAQIYAEGGITDKWSQLGIDITSKGSSDEIVRVSRQNSSGTYFYFREHVLNNKDYRSGSRDMSGSKDVVELVGKTIGAIGYSGMGYVTEAVKFVKIAKTDGQTAYEPSMENVATGNYPLARSLLMYTLGQPEGEVKEYIDWILSPAGQEIVEKSGYIPVQSGQKK
jgi:phosphate transport system substrate-binding protein